MTTQDQEIERIAEELKESIESGDGIEEVSEYVKQIRSIGVERYSTGNQLRLVNQIRRRDNIDVGSAKYFQGMRTWSEKRGRWLKEDVDAFKIISPPIFKPQCPECGKSPDYHRDGSKGCNKHKEDDPEEDWDEGKFYKRPSVYEYSQTIPITDKENVSLDDVEAEEVWEPEDRDAEAKDVDAEQIRDAVKKVIDERGIDIQDYDPENLTGTQVINAIGDTKGGSTGGTVVMMEEMDPATETQVLLHELAHEELHQNDDVDLSRSAEEVEAEAVAYLVCQQVGIETQSKDYLRGWNEEETDVWTRFRTLVETADSILNDIED